MLAQRLGVHRTLHCVNFLPIRKSNSSVFTGKAQRASLGAPHHRAYLGSDTLRRYTLGDLETTVSRASYRRGQRLVIYDAGGDFDRGFEWWERCSNGKDVLSGANCHSKTAVAICSPVTAVSWTSRTSISLRRCSSMPSTKAIGSNEQFEQDMQSLLDRHLLAGLVDAPWVRTGDPERAGDLEFFSALQELVAYVFEESVRVKKKSGILFRDRTKYRPDHPEAFCMKCSRCCKSIAVK